MDTFAGWIGLVGAVIAILVALGGIAVYLGAAKDKGTISSLMNSNAALETELATLQRKVAACEQRESELTTRVAALESENADLRSQRPSAEAIEELRAQVAKHDEETRKLLRAIVSGIAKEQRSD